LRRGDHRYYYSLFLTAADTVFFIRCTYTGNLRGRTGDFVILCKFHFCLTKKCTQRHVFCLRVGYVLCLDENLRTFLSILQIIKTNVLDWDVLAKKPTTKASCHGGWNVIKNYVTGISIMVYVILSPAHVHICIIFFMYLRRSLWLFRNPP
jgi:hypothetical protein